MALGSGVVLDLAANGRDLLTIPPTSLFHSQPELPRLDAMRRRSQLSAVAPRIEQDRQTYLGRRKSTKVNIC